MCRSRRRTFHRPLHGGQRAFERRARLVDDDLPEQRALDAGQTVLLRAFQRHLAGVDARRRMSRAALRYPAGDPFTCTAPKTKTSEGPPHGSTLATARPASMAAICCG